MRQLSREHELLMNPYTDKKAVQESIKDRQKLWRYGTQPIEVEEIDGTQIVFTR